MIYQPALVRIAPGTTVEILDNSADPNFNDTFNRPALAVTFEERSSAERFTVVVNHFKSKGGLPCAQDSQPDDNNQGQGNCNVTRTNAAKALVNWLKTDPTHSGDNDVLIIGDLNAYAMEDPIAALEAGGYRNLIKLFSGPKAYSFVFDGQSGYLDYALASPSLTAQVTQVAEWHINADEPSVLDYNEEFKSPGQRVSLYSPEPYRAADHDPVVVGLRLGGM